MALPLQVLESSSIHTAKLGVARFHLNLPGVFVIKSVVYVDVVRQGMDVFSPVVIARQGI